MLTPSYGVVSRDPRLMASTDRQIFDGGSDPLIGASPMGLAKTVRFCNSLTTILSGPRVMSHSTLSITTSSRPTTCSTIWRTTDMVVCWVGRGAMEGSGEAEPGRVREADRPCSRRVGRDGRPLQRRRGR